MRGLITRHGPILATLLVAAGLYVFAGLRYDGFFSLAVFAGFFSENAFLGIAAIGMTFVIISGGIDLSVGAVVGCSSILIATLVEVAGWHPVFALIAALVFGVALGVSMGGLIHAFDLPPFIVTLGGMFFARGLGFVIHQEAISIEHGFVSALYDLPARAAAAVGVPDEAARRFGTLLPVSSMVLLAVVAVGIYLSRWTRPGRAMYALGGDEESARLMGLPVARTRVAVYGFSGFCSALAGGVYALYTYSGKATAGTMLELDAIAAAVIGGTLLSGGVGSVLGTLLGVLIFGIIQTAIVFDGSLSSWWTRIAIGTLLLGFILLQRLLQTTLAGRGAG
jgi:simple sugar transport system permease protein